MTNDEIPNDEGMTKGECQMTNDAGASTLRGLWSARDLSPLSFSFSFFRRLDADL
jgi:hypothetical protein